MTDAEIEAHARYTDGAVDEIFDLARAARLRADAAIFIAAIALIAALVSLAR